MTKAELIELLADTDDDAEIFISSDQWGCDLRIAKVEANNDTALLIVES